ncbi:MAG: glycosyltransferase [Candidatus Methanomethylicia archaeon]|nr:glycosyltransferase [Candidatus Methanomethylicia archaeon]
MVAIDEYLAIVGESEIDGIKQLAGLIKGEKVVHVNATPYGGGVAEMLRRVVPLAQSLGISASWQTIRGNEEFFSITKRLHNALQGDASVGISEGEWKKYHDIAEFNSSILSLDGDVVVIHDPQPLPLINFKKGGKWVWRCHIDTSSPNMGVWSRLSGMVNMFDASVFSMERYIPKDLEIQALIDHPTIDPLSPKNEPLSADQIEKVLLRYGLDPERPIIGQVGRYDPWKDPIGAIKVYRSIKSEMSSVQFVMIGSFAKDDPEGSEWYNKTVSFAGKDKDCFILSNLDGVGDIEVNAFQRGFSAALQMSIREGFGLTVTEALWKGVPVVATRAGGIPLQVIDGVTGFLVSNYEEAAGKLRHLLKKRWLARELGQAGMRHVRLNFLITKGIMDYIRMHIELVGKSKATAR